MGYNKYFSLFANCIVVKGSKENLMCDMQRGEIRAIDENLVELFNMCKTYKVSELCEIIRCTNKEALYSFFDSLVKLEIGFYTSDIKLFPPIDLTWYNPSKITNAILDFKLINDDISINSIISQLNILGCKAIQLRFYRIVLPKRLETLIKSINSTGIKSIELILRYDKSQIKSILNLVFRYFRINKIVFYNSPMNKFESIEEKAVIYYLKHSILNNRNCGTINSGIFHSNIKFFTEAQHHNIAPINGIITLPGTISKDVFIPQGTPVCSIVPVTKDTGNKKLARAMTPISGVGKIEKGSRVIIRFDAYPYKEYGTLDTKVEDISLLPIKDNEGKVYYDLTIKLPDTLITNYDKTIPYRPNMSGVALIITKDRTVFERIFDKFLNLVKNE